MMRSYPAVALFAFTLVCVGCSGDDGSTPAGPDGPPPPSVPTEWVEWVEWVRTNARPFDTPAVRDDRSDVAFLSDMVGDATIVALGEATHGTREFFQMKHRMLDYLVREKSFNLFAIEATWPEMNRIDDWVRGGDGDPEVLLSGQYFWTWNTQEVMDLILWARDYNRGRLPQLKVGVVGFDMQYPGMAIHNVVTFLEDTDAALAATAQASYSCYKPFSNVPDGRSPRNDYSTLPLAERNTCRVRIDAAHALLRDNAVALVAASSQSAFDLALQSARLVQQNEDSRSNRVTSARDRYMAENTLWLQEQAGPNAKIVLWAHNFHVSTQSGSQGGFLRAAVGDDMVVFGFAFARGAFTAVTRTGTTFAGLTTHTVGTPPTTSYEAVFEATAMPRFVLDHRGLDLTTPGGRWYRGPHPMRSIGCCFDPENPSSFTRPQRIPNLYDVIIYFGESSPSVRLPFNYPTEF